MHHSPDEPSKATCPAGKNNENKTDDSNNESDKAGHETGPDMMDIKSTHPEEVSGGIFSGENGKDYCNMSRWDTLFALITNQLGLGILSLPACLKVLGLIPGIVTILCVALVTRYTGMELHQFYCRHHYVINVVEMVKIVGGRSWGIVAGIGLLIQVMMTCASAAVTLSIAFNTLSNHGTCTVGFIGIGCLGCWVLCMPRTVKFVSRSGIPCFVSIIAAALIVMISLGVKEPSQAPEGWKVKIELFGNPSFREVFNACLRVIYAFAGNHTFVSYMAEMRDPIRDFPFALGWLVSISTVLYSILAITIYCLAGEYTTSPALGSAPLIPAKIAYGIIIPAIFTTGLANGHVGIKYIYIEVMRWIKATDEVTQNTKKSWTVWATCVTAYWIICFILSNAIPIFDSILSISSATTYAWFTYGVSAVLWFSLNKGSMFDGWKKICLFCLNSFLILFSLFLNGGGLWSSITELLDTFADDSTTVQGSFSCGDNALF
ncbi:hypothetical protein G7Z17_g5801 [Cylindrodendrum hubeiense]|uniref:Amino acid transporter transmembrane domain-containing protein n=1 Tax=Cylindrodendrum hubeiense TaxID=595255 RepID=A0A9P5HC98_9HYPO|nr:hypothetical protein G7Z17_g5801 [Cylindrodendrum hubeiense]